MLETLTYAALAITVLITGYYAAIFLRDPQAALKTATHRAELLPQVMAGRYTVVFLLTVGVLVYNDLRVTTYYFAVCAFMGFYDGWLYWRRGLPHFKHTITGLLAFGALGLALLALATGGGA
jgi:ABC-type xylose transport system permease subunit